VDNQQELHPIGKALVIVFLGGPMLLLWLWFMTWLWGVTFGG
jgi:hypothetical protein